MKIENLKEGMVIKNYRELCGYLGWNVTTGNAKKSQFKDLERYCKYHKEGQKIIVDEIYNEPLPPVENKRNDVYGEYLEKFIIHELSYHPLNEHNVINMPKGELFLKLHMVNSNYGVGRNHINKFSRYLNMPTQIVHEFYHTSSTKMRSAIERTLNRLQSRCLIKYTMILYVRTINNEKRPATEEETKVITEIERQVLVELELLNKQDAFVKGKWKEYQDEVNNRTTELFGIKYSYMSYHIYTTSDFRKMMLDSRELECNSEELKSKLHSSTIKTGVSNHKRKVKQFENEEAYWESDKCALLPQYEEYIKKLADITMTDNPQEILGYDTFLYEKNEVYTYDEFIERLLINVNNFDL